MTHEQAIDVLRNTAWLGTYKDLSLVEQAIITLQPKMGKWIIKNNPGTGWYRITCSECGEDVTSVVPTIGFMPNVRVLWDFCPECGAKMEDAYER